MEELDGRYYWKFTDGPIVNQWMRQDDGTYALWWSYVVFPHSGF